MSKKLYEESSIRDIANAIREKNGTTTKYKVAEMGAAVTALPNEDTITHADIPSYVKAEALAVAEKVKAVMEADSIVFLAISDLHHTGPQVDNWQTNINAGNLHACQALKVLSYSLPQIDFACMLGDVTFGNAKTTTQLMQQQFNQINGWLGEAWKNIPQLRTVGNHDTGEYSTLVGAQFLKNNIWKYNEGAVYGSEEYGYCYRDFAEKKLRVICLNTCEGETVSGESAAYCCSPEQLLWFAQTLYAVGSKADAAQWGIIVLGHYPLDLGGAYPTGNIVKAYVAGESTVQNGVTVNFSGHNAAKFIMNVHGHNHCFQFGKLHSVANGQGTEFDAWRMCTPNACFYRNNSGVVTMNGISFGDPAPHDKTAGTGKDTAFNVNVINPSEQVLYSFCYGAGIDRTIGYAATVYYSITNTLTNVTTSNDAVAAEDGTAYSATITAADGYTMSSVTVAMGGTDITSTAYNSDTGVVSIAAVTGDVVITAKATKVVSYHNLVPTAIDSNGASAPYTDGQMLSSSGTTSEDNHFTTTGFIPFDGAAVHIYRIGGEGITWNEYGARLAWYNADFTLKGSVLSYNQLDKSIYYPTKIDDPNAAVAFSTDANVAPPHGAAYFRVSAKGKGENLVVTLDEKIE
ncbi:MAG: metallophosphoesterase [Acutalibacteraceae bacterium]|nr:metallophosphoesterase [Acutalibacteraceae bacterium]